MIHPQAIVEPGAELAPDVEVGPWSYISKDVKIGEGTVIGPNVVIKGPTVIGKHNKIHQFASIGEDPQDKKYQGTPTRLEIGDHNIFREHTTVNRGTEHGTGITVIGSHNLFMNYVHVAHDCWVGNHVTFSNTSSLAGHVTVHDFVTVGGFVGIHQFCTIGERSFLGGGTMVTKDVPPYVIVSGYPSKVYGINKVGLRRADFSDKTITMLQKAYKILYRKGLTLVESIVEIDKMTKDAPEVVPFIEFLRQYRERGIIR